MNTKLSAQLFGLGLWLTSTACGSRTSLMQDDAGVDAGEQTSSVSASSSSGGRGGSGTTTGRAGSAASGGRAGAPGTTGSAGGMARAGRGGSAMSAGGKGGEGGKAPAADGGKGGKSDEGGKGGGKATEQGGEGGKGGEKAPEQGGEGGKAGEVAQGGAGGEAGASGMPAAGSGGTTGTGVMLSMLSAEQKTALCARVDDGVRDQPLMDAVRGYCSSLGLRQPAMCPQLRDSCFDGPQLLPVCTDTVPDCPNITEDEFVACRVDDIKRFVAYNRVITCDNPNSIPAGTSDPMSCVGPYERCPALRGLAR